MKRWILGFLAIVVLCFMYLPLVVVAIYSFNRSRFGAGWGGFTTQWYRVLWTNEFVAQAFYNSIVVAAISTFVALILGTLLGYGLSRGGTWERSLWASCVELPIVVPDILLALGLLLLFGALRDAMDGGNLGIATIIVGHITLQIPFVAVIVRARLSRLSPALEAAAADLGATPLQRWRYVIIPLLRPALVAGALLSFTLSLDDVVVSFFMAGPGATTLPVLIYASVKRGITPDINALSTLMIVASATVSIGVAVIFHRKEKV